jgi:twitching motility protein PilT
MKMISILQAAKERGASDLHLVADGPPLMRIHGSLNPAEDMDTVKESDLEEMLREVTSEEQQQIFAETMELDFGASVEGVGRVRFNAARQRGSISFVNRLLPDSVPGPEALGLPDICKDLIQRPRGLVVVSGPTGSGKSTTLASMIQYLNEHENARVITIEDPIEYTYQNKRATITQRELGADTLSFSEALRHVLRQDPDVILVGEMRDLETASAALTVAETGHLVLTTGHAPSASQAVERIINMFPPHERNLTQSRLASLLLGILCQALVPKADGGGRVAAIEVMLANSAVRNLIREGKTFQIPNTIRMNSNNGMELLDQALVRLWRQHVINKQSVWDFCNDREEITKLTGEQEDNLQAGGGASGGPAEDPFFKQPIANSSLNNLSR